MGKEEAFRQVQALLRSRKDVVKDVDVDDVLPDLISFLAIDHREKQYIDNENSSEDKAERLVDILVSKVTSAEEGDDVGHVIPAFFTSLKEKYPWLYSKVTEDVPDSFQRHASRVVPIVGGGRPFSPGLRNRLFDNVLQDESPYGRGEGQGETSNEQRLRMILDAGGVQCLPPVTIEREQLLNQIKEGLRDLKGHCYLVLHGMAGSGKSVLATQAVNDLDLVDDVFPSGVFWLTIGKECSESKDALLSKMRILCEKLGESRPPNSFDHGADLLRTAFLKRTNTLLILDDVWRPEVIRAFDVGCRMMITTRDLSVMDVVNGRYAPITVDVGFTEAESLSLFSQVLNIQKKEDLPVQARQIHLECKGSPMVISLVSSLMKERQFSDPERWQYYLDALSDRKHSKVGKFRGYEYESISDAISLSFQSLTKMYQRFYIDFALFQDDIGIPCSVLMTLWGMQKYEVEDIMKDFVRKSLVTEEYDLQKKCYIYSVHDLLLDFLKTKVASDGVETQGHKKLVDRYINVCEEQFYKLPDDGYIFFYLGYHLYKSKMYQYFQKVYLNLLFIGEKLRVTGPADLLVDIRKYLDFIVGGDDDNLKIIDDVQAFAQLVGHKLYGQLDIDVIQVALQTPHLTWVHEQAKSLAQQATCRLYLEWRNPGQWKHAESTVLCTDHVYCIKSVGCTGNNFVAGLSNGCIQLCDFESSAVCHIFFGHKDIVHSLDIYPARSSKNRTISPTSCQLVSSSTDKTCKIWSLQSILQNIESKAYELTSSRKVIGSPSPKLRPDHWVFDQQDESLVTFSLHTAAVTNAQFSPDGTSVISTSTNEIMIWKSENAQIFYKISPAIDGYPELNLHRCLFPPEYSNDYNDYLLCCAENHLLLMSARKSSLYTSVEAHPLRIVEILFLSPNCFCTVSESEIGLWKVKRINLSSPSKGKAARSRSLSPSRCAMMKTNSTNQKANLRQIKTLDPKDIQVNWIPNGNGSGEEPTGGGDRDGRRCVKSSSATMSNGTVVLNYPLVTSSALINLENYTIEIVKEDLLYNQTNGILLCASMSFNEDRTAQVLACGTSDHKIVLWSIDEKSSTFLGSFTSHTGWVTCLDFSTVDSCCILSGSEDHTVMCWDIQEEEKGTREPEKNVHFASSYITAGENNGRVISAFFTENNVVQLYRNSKRMCETRPFENLITCIAISDDGKYLAVGTKEGKVFRYRVLISSAAWEVEDLKPLKLQSQVCCLRFGVNNGLLLAAGSSSGDFCVFKDDSVVNSAKLSESKVVAGYFINETVAVAVVQDGTAVILSADDVNVWKGVTDIHVTCCDFNREGLTLVLGTIKYGAIILKLSEKGVSEEYSLNVQASSPIRSLAINSHCTQIAIGFDNGLISIWQIGGDVPVKEMELVLHKSWVRCLKFSIAGPLHWLISCGDSLAVWSLDRETQPRRMGFLTERRRRRSGESPARNPNRLSLEIPHGTKIGRQGKRELLQQFSFRGNYAQFFVTDPNFRKITTVDDTGVFYFLETLKGDDQKSHSAKC